MHAAGIAVLFAAALVALPGRAMAQPTEPAPAPESGDLDAAAEHYQLAETAAAEKRWKDAAREYGVAYEHSRDPVLFFKLASALQSAGDCAAALGYFKRYLAEAKPNEQFEKLTRERIAACEAATSPAPEPAPEPAPSAQPKAPAPAPVEPPAPFADAGESPAPPAGATPVNAPYLGADHSWQRTAAWISVGAAVAFATTGGVLGLAAGSREDDIQAQIDFRDPTRNVPARFEGNVAERHDELIDQGERLELLSIITFAAAGAAAGAAVVFFILDPGPEADEVSLAPAIGRDTIGASATWRFE